MKSLFILLIVFTAALGSSGFNEYIKSLGFSEVLPQKNLSLAQESDGNIAEIERNPGKVTMNNKLENSKQNNDLRSRVLRLKRPSNSERRLSRRSILRHKKLRSNLKKHSTRSLGSKRRQLSTLKRHFSPKSKKHYARISHRSSKKSHRHTKERRKLNRYSKSHKQAYNSKSILSKLKLKNKLHRRLAGSCDGVAPNNTNNLTNSKQATEDRSFFDVFGSAANTPAHALGVQFNSTDDGQSSAIGSAMLGYGLYNKHKRNKGFKFHDRLLRSNYQSRELYLSSISSQVGMLHEVSMGLSICKNRIRRIQDLFASTVLSKVRPGIK